MRLTESTLIVLSSAGARAFVSSQLKLDEKRALTFNAVDMLISGFASKYILKNVKNEEMGLLLIATSRVFSVLAASFITERTVGSIHSGIAIRLNVISAVVALAIQFFNGTSYIVP